MEDVRIETRARTAPRCSAAVHIRTGLMGDLASVLIGRGGRRPSGEPEGGVLDSPKPADRGDIPTPCQRTSPGRVDLRTALLASAATHAVRRWRSGWTGGAVARARRDGPIPDPQLAVVTEWSRRWGASDTLGDARGAASTGVEGTRLGPMARGEPAWSPRLASRAGWNRVVLASPRSRAPTRGRPAAHLRARGTASGSS